MEAVFITIHDLSLDARIKYCSDSVEEILGYRPAEVKGKSCWEYFHPDEIPFARAIHGRGLELEKAAALNYCRIRHKNGEWISCECVFTVVYDVLVASTAIYTVGEKAQRRAVDGAAVRRVFASTPRDPRYHMLSYIANKFTQNVEPHSREPRAALILNRFSRTSPIMFATNGVEQILGFNPTQLTGKSFYYCIAENCLGRAVRTVESAKHNDSIAYLRFFFRDPTLPDPMIEEHLPQETESDTDESEDGGVRLRSSRDSSVSMTSAGGVPSNPTVPRIAVDSPQIDGTSTPQEHDNQLSHESDGVEGIPSRTSSGNSTDMDTNGNDGIFDQPMRQTRSSASSNTPQEDLAPRGVEVEAVVSCTSDGLVVVLRKAHSLVPQTAAPDSAQPAYPDGLFASPWATEPVLPDGMQQATSVPSMTPLSEPTESGFMSAIRDVAVFAWSLTGINGSIVDYASGKGSPAGDAIPPGGLPIWDPNAPVGQNDQFNGFGGGTHRPVPGWGERGERDSSATSSDDEVVWRRVPQVPTFKRPKRRAYRDAFGTDDEDSTDNGGGVAVQDRRRRKLDGDGKPPN